MSGIGRRVREPAACGRVGIVSGLSRSHRRCAGGAGRPCRGFVLRSCRRCFLVRGPFRFGRFRGGIRRCRAGRAVPLVCAGPARDGRSRPRAALPLRPGETAPGPVGRQRSTDTDQHPQQPGQAGHPEHAGRSASGRRPLAVARRGGACRSGALVPRSRTAAVVRGRVSRFGGGGGASGCHAGRALACRRRRCPRGLGRDDLHHPEHRRATREPGHPADRHRPCGDGVVRYGRRPDRARRHVPGSGHRPLRPARRPPLAGDRTGTRDRSGYRAPDDTNRRRGLRAPGTGSAAGRHSRRVLLADAPVRHGAGRHRPRTGRARAAGVPASPLRVLHPPVPALVADFRTGSRAASGYDRDRRPGGTAPHRPVPAPGTDLCPGRPCARVPPPRPVGAAALRSRSGHRRTTGVRGGHSRRLPGRPTLDVIASRRTGPGLPPALPTASARHLGGTARHRAHSRAVLGGGPDVHRPVVPQCPRRRAFTSSTAGSRPTALRPARRRPCGSRSGDVTGRLPASPATSACPTRQAGSGTLRLRDRQRPVHRGSTVTRPTGHRRPNALRPVRRRPSGSRPRRLSTSRRIGPWLPPALPPASARRPNHHRAVLRGSPGYLRTRVRQCLVRRTPTVTRPTGHRPTDHQRARLPRRPVRAVAPSRTTGPGRPPPRRFRRRPAHRALRAPGDRRTRHPRARRLRPRCLRPRRNPLCHRPAAGLRAGCRLRSRLGLVSHRLCAPSYTSISRPAARPMS